MSQDKWVHCPKCRYPMVTLVSYDQVSMVEAVNDAEVEESGWHPWDNRRQGANPLKLLELLWKLFDYFRRKRKLAYFRRYVLPAFPNSLLCANCFHLLRRP